MKLSTVPHWRTPTRSMTLRCCNVLRSRRNARPTCGASCGPICVCGVRKSSSERSWRGLGPMSLEPGQTNRRTQMQEDAVTNDENATHRCDLLCPVAHLMRAVPFVDPESTLRTAAQAMVAQGDGVAVVLGPEGPARIVTEHDIVCALAQQADPNTVWVADVAPSNLISAELTATILDVIRQM